LDSQVGVTETIEYAIVDNDGDPSGTGTLTLDIQAPVIGTPTLYTNLSAGDQEISTNISNTTVNTDSGDDWVHNSYIYQNATLNTYAGEDLITTDAIGNNAIVTTGADDDRIYMKVETYYTYIVDASIDMGDGNDLFYFNYDLNDTNTQVNTSTIDMGAGKDVLVFTQNNRTDFTFTNTASGLQIILSKGLSMKPVRD